MENLLLSHGTCTCTCMCTCTITNIESFHVLVHVFGVLCGTYTVSSKDMWNITQPTDE